MSPLTFCCLLKSKVFSTILIILFEFLFSGIFLLLPEFLKLINDPLMFFTILLFLIWLSSYKCFAKNDGNWKLKYFLNISLFIFFSSFLISFKKFSHPLNGDIFHLVLGVPNNFDLGGGLGLGACLGACLVLVQHLYFLFEIFYF